MEPRHIDRAMEHLSKTRLSAEEQLHVLKSQLALMESLATRKDIQSVEKSIEHSKELISNVSQDVKAARTTMRWVFGLIAVVITLATLFGKLSVTL